MNYFKFLMKSALFNFSRNKGRTFLTSLGILIGVLSVVLLMAAGLGLKKYVKNQFDSLGSNLMYILPGRVIAEGGGFQDPGALAARFDETDIRRVERVPNVTLVVPANERNAIIFADGNKESTQVLSTSEGIAKALNLEIDVGEFFTKADVNKRAKKVVLGSDTAKKLFGSAGSAIGRQVKVSDRSYKVVGVVKSKGGGGLGGPNFDAITFVPYRSSPEFDESKKFYTIYLKAASDQAIPQLKLDLKELLLKRYEEDEFQVVEQTEVLNIVTNLFSVLNTVLVAIAAISLVVGGIGIMNIMYVTVTEKIKEIGIRRALGARKKDILYQFLVESVILSLFGGLIGLLLAYIIVLFVQPYFPAYIDAQSVMLSVGISSGIGVIFGVFPAKKAADLVPMDAIRFE